MDLRDYDVEPENIVTGLRQAIEDERDYDMRNRHDAMSMMSGGYSVPNHLEGYSHRRKVGSTQRGRKPDWMKNPALLPKTPPPLPKNRRDDDDAA